MKSYVLATASVLAIMMSGANAIEEKGDNAVATPTAEQAMKGHAEKGPMAEKKAEHPCPTHKRHHKKHRKHAHHAKPTSTESNFYMPVVQPCGCETTCEASPCEATCCEGSVVTPEYYGGNQAHPYWYAGGYFWYPHSRADMLPQYTPLNVDGMYWYPSRLHPHSVYAEKAQVVYTYPRPLQAQMAMEPR
jgi:hypothetical protein